MSLAFLDVGFAVNVCKVVLAGYNWITGKSRAEREWRQRTEQALERQVQFNALVTIFILASLMAVIAVLGGKHLKAVVPGVMLA